MYAHIGRQPVFNAEKKVVGYELLYRSRRVGNAADFVDGDAATRSVLSDAIAVFGISQLTNRLPAYINFTRNLILNDFAFLADPKEIVIELVGKLDADDILISKLKTLKNAGYTLALDDAGAEVLKKVAQLFDIARVDVSGKNKLQLMEVQKKLSSCGCRLLAEKVETIEDFIGARDVGFSLFQGYFFERPMIMSKQVPSLAASSYGRLINELLMPEPNYDLCAQVIQSDVMLTYLFLRQSQTASYSPGNIVSDIRQGMVMMGTEELRRWVCLVMLKQSNVTHSDEVPRQAYLRGRFVEVLMSCSTTSLDRRLGFLMGLFSLLDKVMGVRLETLFQGMKLDEKMKAALLGKEENEYSMFLQYAVIYEMNNERLVLPDIHLRITEEQVAQVYLRCISETDTAFARVGGGG